MIIELTQSWNKYLEKFEDAQKDIYYFEEYVKLYEKKESVAACVVCMENDMILLMPFIRNKIGEYYDFETAYGYGGPIANTHNVLWISQAIEEVKAFLKKKNYICGFIRFHTLLNNALICQSHFNVLFDRSTVAIDTSKSEEQIWMEQISSKNRNMIRKAEKNGLVYKAEYDFASLDEFIQLYDATMMRLDAQDFYYFNQKYYKDFVDKFANQAFLGTVRKDGKLICAALFMYSKNYGHYHLEGSDYAYSSLGANNLLLWKTSLELSKLGIKQFHLGGGYDCEPDNSLLKFKKAFSRNLKEFYIGKMILNKDVYNALKGEWAKNNPQKVKQYGNLLLCYRY